MANDQQKLQEQGFPAPPPPPASTLPPGGGTWVIPSYQEFASIINAGGARTWRVLFDEALQSPGGVINSQAMRHDIVIMDILQTIYTPVVQLEWLLEPEDDTDPRQGDAASRITADIERTPMWQFWLRSQLEGIFYGKAAVQNLLRFNPARRAGRGSPRLEVADWQPVHGDSLVRKWSGEWGILVHGTEFAGTTEATDYYLAHFLTPAERERFVIHQHEPEMATFTEAQSGGRILGVGLRDRMWHIWWIRATVQTYMLDFVQRLSQGFTIYFYEAGNAESLAEVQKAAQQQLGQNTILFPRSKDQGQRGPGVERLEVGAANQQLLIELVTQYYDGLLRRYGLMQSLTNEVGSSELGGDASGALEAALSRCIKYHAVNLADTINRDFLPLLYKYNEPGVPPARFKFVVDKPDADKLIQNALALVQAGASVDAQVLMDMAGVPAPEAGHPILSMTAPQQPTAVNNVPAGMPVAGPAGPLPSDAAQAQGQAPGANGQYPPPAQAGDGAAAQPQSAQQFARRRQDRLRRYLRERQASIRRYAQVGRN